MKQQFITVKIIVPPEEMNYSIPIRVMYNILFVDSDESLLLDVCSYLRSTGMQIQSALDLETARTLIKNEHFDLIISDVRFPGGTVRELLHSAREKDPSTEIIVSSEIDTVDEAVRAVKEGAYEILKKPFSMPELMFHIKRALEKRSQDQGTADSEQRFANIYQPANFIGQSPGIKRVFDIVYHVAKTKSSVIISGETGTGKELVAGSIHYNSKRSSGPFVRVNCAALPESLLESELFGYAQGAFTGAEKTRIGRFEQANGGSIFLDEIADMSMHTQAKVLRVLQEREFERVGSNKTVKVDVRIISATNKDILSLVEKNEFREDLYYRLNVVNIHLPPLRDRKEDLRLLVQFFVRKYSIEVDRKIRSVHREALKMLSDYHWPGNIRELENTIERTVVMTEGDVITPELLRPLFAKRTLASGEEAKILLPPNGVCLEDVEKSLVNQALERSNWIQKDAANLLNISSRVLNYKIKRFAITHESWRQNK